MTIDVGISYPPHRDGIVAEFNVTHGDVLDIPAEIFRADGHMMIALYSRSDGVAWEYPLSEFLGAIATGIQVVERE